MNEWRLLFGAGTAGSRGQLSPAEALVRAVTIRRIAQLKGMRRGGSTAAQQTRRRGIPHDHGSKRRIAQRCSRYVKDYELLTSVSSWRRELAESDGDEIIAHLLSLPVARPAAQTASGPDAQTLPAQPVGLRPEACGIFGIMTCLWAHFRAE